LDGSIDPWGSISTTLRTNDLEVLEYSGIFVWNPEYRILFQNNLLGAKWADCAEV